MNQHIPHSVFGIGSYSIPEAARLLSAPKTKIRRWVSGYGFRNHTTKKLMPPLWRMQHQNADNHFELGFRDLIELRFVLGFMKTGLSLSTIRFCLDEAQKEIGEIHPFSTQKFETDGKTIFLKTLREAGEPNLLDLKKKQYALAEVIKQTFKDLNFEDGLVTSWRPYKGKQSIVIDPHRSFGQPIASDSGVPTTVLAEAVEAEGSISAVSRLYEVALQVVRDAVAFEKVLAAGA